MLAMKIVDVHLRLLQSMRYAIGCSRALLAEARDRLRRSRTVRLASLSPETRNRVIFEALTRPESAPILAALIDDAETIADDPRQVARLIVERLKADPLPLHGLLGMPLPAAEQAVAEATMLDRLGP